MKKKSYAKINIGLEVVGKRPDGFHNIETIFQQIDLCDEMEFSKSNEICIQTNSPHCPDGPTNLAYKAAVALCDFVDQRFGANIYIDKQIPVSAGLGGGSSNAATTLVALNKVYGLELGDSELEEIALKLGSDVPFFVRGGTALGQGRGEILEPIVITKHYYGVIVVPSYGISTKWAYENSNFSLTKRNKKSNFGTFFLNSADYESWRSVLKNDLEPAVFSAYPELRKIKDQFYTQGAFYAQMSGSGSSLYGLFWNKNDAVNAQKHFGRKKTYLFEPV